MGGYPIKCTTGQYHFALIKSQISGPCYESDNKPDPYEFLWESHVHLQIHVVFEDFYHQKKQNPAWFQ